MERGKEKANGSPGFLSSKHSFTSWVSRWWRRCESSKVVRCVVGAVEVLLVVVVVVVLYHVVRLRVLGFHTSHHGGSSPEYVRGRVKVTSIGGYKENLVDGSVSTVWCDCVGDGSAQAL